MKNSVAVLGLGNMGSVIATRLETTGFDVTVFNRTREKAEYWCEKHGSRMATTPGSAVIDADVVIVCVRDDHALRALMDGEDGVWCSVGRGALIIDHSTTSVEAAREMHLEAARRDIDFLDAPLFGNAKSLVDGQVGIVAGGEKSAFQRAQKLFQSYAASMVLAGPAGTGQLMKMVNQICMAGIILSLTEALSFAEAVDCDTNYVLASLAAGSANSWQLENRGRKMVERDFEGPGLISLLSKDMDICLAEAQRQGLSLPVAERMGKVCQYLNKAGHGDWDAAGLISLIRSQY